MGRETAPLQSTKVPDVKITMQRSKMGSNDGATVKMYEKDETYEVSESLGEAFIRDQDAVEAAETANVTAPEFVEGVLYHDADGNLFVGVTTPEMPDVHLLPIEQLADEERLDLIKEGKLKEDGTAVDSKAIDAAPKNKAIAKAPKNKAK